VADDGSFLGRWSRRKQAVREGQPVAEAPRTPEKAPPAPENLPVATDSEPKLPGAQAGRPSHATNTIANDIPPPSLEDTRLLTPESDFKPFMARGVAPEVKNAAMKKLFADPHFNVMDMMDVYVDDYSQPTPIPESVLRQMVSAQFLDLFDEQKNRDKAAADAAPPPAGDSVAHSTHDNDPDLRLQPDDAPGPESPGHGAG
jgi:hypothetical protein